MLTCLLQLPQTCAASSPQLLEGTACTAGCRSRLLVVREVHMQITRSAGFSIKVFLMLFLASSFPGNHPPGPDPAPTTRRRLRCHLMP